jgi:hypothetical protein
VGDGAVGVAAVGDAAVGDAAVLGAELGERASERCWPPLVIRLVVVVATVAVMPAMIAARNQFRSLRQGEGERALPSPLSFDMSVSIVQAALTDARAQHDCPCQ